MPYIPWRDRLDLTPLTNVATTEGELNFQLTSLLVEYIIQNGLSYERIGDVEGALRTPRRSSLVG